VGGGAGWFLIAGRFYMKGVERERFCSFLCSRRGFCRSGENFIRRLFDMVLSRGRFGVGNWGAGGHFWDYGFQAALLPGRHWANETRGLGDSPIAGKFYVRRQKKRGGKRKTGL